MIPKIIHYCWFGRGKKPQLAEKCLKSWTKYCPGYVIKEWNEDNFDLDLYPYAREAYDNRKFAFVTDIVRLYALYTEGGIYMDTDVEVVKPLDEFLSLHAFSGYESLKDVPTGIMASEKNGKWAKENLDYYNERHFINEDGTFDLRSNVKTITRLLLPYGLRRDNTYQDFPDMITMFPKEYFCPKSYETREIKITQNTYCIHHFNGSWWPKGDRFKAWLITKGLNKTIAFAISKSIFFPTHVFQHLFDGSFLKQVKLHLEDNKK